MLITEDSVSGETNELLNAMKEHDSAGLIDKIYLYARHLNEPKYQFLIRKCEDVGIKYLNDPKEILCKFTKNVQVSHILF